MLPASFCGEIVSIRKLCANCWWVCTLKSYQLCEEPPFAGAAISNGGCLHEFPGRAGIDVLSALWRINLILASNFTGTALHAGRLLVRFPMVSLQFLGPSAKLRKATFSFACPPVLMGHLGSHWTGSWNLSIFRKSVEKIHVSLISDKNNGYFTFMVISRSVLHRMRNVSDRSCREKTRILCSILPPPLPRKSCGYWDNGEKYFWARKATDDNMTHVHCILVTKGFKDTTRLSNT
jgi:hypothetical protein